MIGPGLHSIYSSCTLRCLMLPEKTRRTRLASLPPSLWPQISDGHSARCGNPSALPESSAGSSFSAQLLSAGQSQGSALITFSLLICTPVPTPHPKWHGLKSTQISVILNLTSLFLTVSESIPISTFYFEYKSWSVSSNLYSPSLPHLRKVETLSKARQ